MIVYPLKKWVLLIITLINSIYKVLVIYNKSLKKRYTTSSCSTRMKNKAKQRPGNTNVTTGSKIGGKKDAVINFQVYLFTLYSTRIRESSNDTNTINSNTLLGKI